MADFWKDELPVSLAEFARRLEPTRLRATEINHFVWRVSPIGERTVVYVQRFGVPELMISLDNRSWRQSQGGIAEIVLLALGEQPLFETTDMRARLKTIRSKMRHQYPNGSPNGTDHYQGASLTAAMGNPDLITGAATGERTQQDARDDVSASVNPSGHVPAATATQIGQATCPTDTNGLPTKKSPAEPLLA